MRHSLLLMIALTLSLTACGSKKDDGGGSATPAAGAQNSANAKTDEKAAKPAAKPEAPAKPALPSETETLALDADKGEIPATITVPQGSTLFFDTPTTVRVSYKDGALFGVQVTRGNEFNTKFDQKDGTNEYGVTVKVIEKTETSVLFTQTSDGFTSHKFSSIIKLGEQSWVCKQGNNGGWSEAQAREQMKACQTLAAKQ